LLFFHKKLKTGSKNFGIYDHFSAYDYLHHLFSEREYLLKNKFWIKLTVICTLNDCQVTVWLKSKLYSSFQVWFTQQNWKKKDHKKKTKKTSVWQFDFNQAVSELNYVKLYWTWPLLWNKISFSFKILSFTRSCKGCYQCLPMPQVYLYI
jgi:hypothetical protein